MWITLFKLRIFLVLNCGKNIIFLSYQVKRRVDVILVGLRRWRRERGGQGCGVLSLAAMEKDFQKIIFGFFVGRKKAFSRTKTDLEKR